MFSYVGFGCSFILYGHLQVLLSDNTRYGYNAATGNYEDLMAAGIIDPTKVRYTETIGCYSTWFITRPFGFVFA